MERKAIEDYVAEGGRVLLTGNTGAFDENARAWTGGGLVAGTLTADWIDDHSGAVTSFADGRLRRVADIHALLPKKKWQVEDVADIFFDELYGERKVDEIIEAAKHEHDDLTVLGLLNDLAGVSLPVLGEDTPLTLRCTTWEKDGSTTLHLVNYDVPGDVIRADIHTVTDFQVEPVPAENVRVCLPVEHGVSKVELANPWHPDPVALDFTMNDGRVEFTVPRVGIYQVVRIG